MQTLTINGKNIQVSKFNSRERAFSFMNHATICLAVMLGDDSRFWVCDMADAQRLERTGYEWAA